jgi:methyl-accepting chemotaxis protein
MYSILDRLRFRDRVRLVQATLIVTLTTLGVSGWLLTGSALEALPEGSSGRSALEVLRVICVAVPVVAIPLGCFLLASILAMLWDILGNAATAMTAAAEGDLKQRMAVKGRGEFAKMAIRFNTMIGNFAEVVDGIRAAGQDLTSSAAALDRASATMNSVVGVTNSKLDEVTASATKVDHDISEVATGTEQMLGAIAEIGTNAEALSDSATAAVSGAGEAAASVHRLRESSQEVGDVIRTITAVAEQTNLLALNATIEAARAGDAGRGFAIVASEVKELAQATAKATDEITRRIESIQSDTDLAVRSVNGFSEAIEAIARYQSAVGTAVREQSITTAAMATNAGEVSESSNAIATAMADVLDSSREAGRANSESQRAAAQVSQTAARLDELIKVFH